MKTKSLFRLYTTIRWIFYIFIIGLAFIFSTIGNSVKPLLLIPIAVCISINEENEMTATIVGIICGLLIDISCDKIFGYNAILLIGICVLASLLFTHFLRSNVINTFLVCSLFSFILGSLDYLFYYAIWGYEHVSRIFFKVTIPCWIYTSISTIIIYLIMRIVYRKFSPKANQTIEETNNQNE